MSQQQSGSASTLGCLLSIVAFVLSYALNHSFWWAVLAFIFSPVYILWALVARSHEIIPALTRMFS